MHPILRKRALALAIAPLFCLAHAEEAARNTLGTIEVTATRIAYPESAATYAAEVHTRKMIEQSGAHNLTDYLAQQSSLTVMSSYGNRFTPTLEMRGYGLESGNQNIVISVDGRRLNNVDSLTQLLGAIPLASVERIEIVKGSGSVLYGDGATAGVINILTRQYDGGTVELRAGDHGAQAGSFSWGTAGENYRLSVAADNDRFDGYAHQDPSGKRDDSDMRNESIALSVKPLTALELKFDAGSTHSDVRYQNGLSPSQFKDDPSQNGGRNYTHQETDADHWRAGAAYAFNERLTLTYDHRRVDQTNTFGFSDTDYDQDADDLALIYTGSDIDLTTGYQRNSGARKQPAGFTPGNQTDKDNEALYVQVAWRVGDTVLSAGGRREQVDYRYAPATGATLSDEHHLSAWDVGINQRLSERWTLFANLNASFLAPDVDRFFSYDFMTGTTSFNQLIDPAKVKTLNLGTHYESARLRGKLTVFRSNLKDEIYFDPSTFINTNIDESHKYGLEVEGRWQVREDVLLNARYVWTRARIDEDGTGAGAYDGKDMPGVPEHGINLSATYNVTERIDLTATHAWRDNCYAISDFDNSNEIRQRRFESTNLNLRYRADQVDYFASINNLFARENGTAVEASYAPPGVIYPNQYERSFVAGARVRF